MIKSLIESTINLIPSPYMGEPNLTLQFDIGSGVFVADSLGNPIEETAITTILASARIAKDAKQQQLDGQIGQQDIPMVGRFVSPKLLPITIGLENTAIAELKDLKSLQIIRGVFRFLPVAQDRFPAVTAQMGMKFKGYLNTTGVV
jgi:hypothetical protein